MVDSHLTVTGNSHLRTQFAERAVLPQREAKEAASFVATLERQIAAGHKPSTTDIKTGATLLDDLDAKRTRFEFNFAQVLASEAADIDSQVDAIGSSLGEIEKTADRLRNTLKSLA